MAKAKTLVLPSNVAAERAVLGAMMMDEQSAVFALSILSVDDFSDVDPRNKLIYDAMVKLNQSHAKIDPQTVNEELTILHTSSEAGGIEYLSELIDTFMNPENINHYVTMVKNNSVLRQYLIALGKIRDDYMDGKASDIASFLQSSQILLTDISENRSVGDFLRADSVAEQTLNTIELKRKTDRTGLTGVETGYPRLNKYTHGWQKENLIFIAARPGVGKTAFAINLAYNAAKAGTTVLFFSGEMSSELIMERLLSSVTTIDSEKIQTGFLNDGQRVGIKQGLQQISTLPIYFDDTPNPALGDILAKSRKVKNVGLIVIDYLNIISAGSSRGSDNRSRELGIVTQSLKGLARSLHVPVICLAQLNRSVEDNENNIPMLSNLKESGKIEEDADLILLMHRGDYWSSLGMKKKEDVKAAAAKYAQGNNSEQGMKTDDFTKKIQQQVNVNKAQGNDKGGMSVVEIMIAKNRNGRIGEVTLMFEKNFSRFTTPTLEMERMVAKNRGIDLPEDDEEE
ncbi:MAG: replicative DNA helicase [Bacilli bacterium]|nr:replicative DNA helicase [Bacilli bacterium]